MNQLNKIKLILWREYLTRIRKRSFIVMTLIGPLLMAGLMVVPIWLSLKDVDIQVIQVIDQSKAFIGEFEDGATIQFQYSESSLPDAKEEFYNTKFTSLLFIPSNAYSAPSGIRLFHKKQPSQKTLSYINNKISEVMERDRINLKYGLSINELKILKPDIDILSISLDESGNEETTHTTLSMLLGFGAAILIYFFIFLYGVQVMRGVIEEKTSRIVEVIISSVKPFQLMLGKIGGIALVGLTQFTLWIILTSLIINGVQGLIPQHIKDSMDKQSQIEQFMPEKSKKTQTPENVLVELNENLKLINIPLILFSFLFYFLFGYLLYGALFAAIGSAVDSEADSQQFMFPITVPLILAFVVAQSVIQNPDGLLAFWFSIIPLTSPVIMMVRIPFGVNIGDVILSMSVLVFSFLFVTWLAGKIYRTGILMYGKKPTYKELWKWMFYKD